MKTKSEKIVELSSIIDNKAERIKKLKVECGQQATKICVLSERIKELEVDNKRLKKSIRAKNSTIRKMKSDEAYDDYIFASD